MNPFRFETNDIVRLKEGAKYEVYRLDKGANNIYRIEASGVDSVRLGYIYDLVPYWDIEPLPIDGKADKYIYLDVVVAASTVAEESQAPIRTIDKTYFVDALKKIKVGDEKTMFDEYLQHDFRYVHEVQHWLRKKGYLDLRIDENKLMNKVLNQLAKNKKMTPDDYMQLSIAEMRKCRQERRNDGKISPSVAAVLIKPDGEVVKAYRGELREGDHAEYTLIERKCGNQDLEGSILYSTLEPCAPGARHYPKLSCAERIVNARIKKVYVGREDPDPTVARKGLFYLQEQGVETELFPKQYEDVITEYNSEFIKQAEERARKNAEEGPQEVILSSIEKEVTSLRFDDLDESLLQQYLERYGVHENVRSGFAIRFFLRSGIIAQDEQGTFYPTGIGILLFGKDPQLTYPNAKVCATMIINGEESIKDITGPLLKQPKEVEDWFKLAVGSKIDRSHAERDTIYNYPLEMLRELVANAILHRDYDIQEAAIQLRVTEGEIVIMSPGAPVKPIELKLLQDFTAPTLSRNPKIISVFNLFHLSEQRGFGFRTVRKSFEDNLIPLPLVSYNAPYLVTTLPRNYEAAMQDTKLSKREKQILDYIRLHGSMTRQQCQETMHLSERTANRVLKDLVDAGYLDPQGESSSTQYVLKEISRQKS